MIRSVRRISQPLRLRIILLPGSSPIVPGSAEGTECQLKKNASHRIISNVDPWMREILSSKGTGCSAHYVVAHSKEHGAEALSGPGGLGSRIQFLHFKNSHSLASRMKHLLGPQRPRTFAAKSFLAARRLPTVDIIQQINIGLSRLQPYRYVMAKHTRARNHTTYLHVPVFLVKRHTCFTRHAPAAASSQRWDKSGVGHSYFSVCGQAPGYRASAEAIPKFSPPSVGARGRQE